MNGKRTHLDHSVAKGRALKIEQNQHTYQRVFVRKQDIQVGLIILLH